MTRAEMNEMRCLAQYGSAEIALSPSGSYWTAIDAKRADGKTITCVNGPWDFLQNALGWFEGTHAVMLREQLEKDHRDLLDRDATRIEAEQ